VQNRIKQNGRRVTAKRNSAGRHLIQHGSEGEQVRPSVEFFAPCLLGRHICSRANRRAWARKLFFRATSLRYVGRWPGCDHAHLGQPKIQNLGVVAVCDETVGGFDIPVNDALGVSRIERIRDLDGEQ
jgi:hypothetical protein